MSVPDPTLQNEHGQWSPASVGETDADDRQSADSMDERRKAQIAYEYLCHLEEAKLWIEACIREELPATIELEEALQNGVICAKLANFFAPEIAPVRKIFDKDLTRYKERGLHFRHTDNIMYLIRSMEHIGLPAVFYPETTDIYDRKNMPRAIYCVHALSLYLFKLGLAPQIQDLYGKAQFTEEEINAMSAALDKYGINMPHFGKIGGILANEMSDNDAALHAAIVAINEAVDRGNAADTCKAMRDPAAQLLDINEGEQQKYQDLLVESKQKKCEQTQLKGKQEAELDMYDKMLTQAEIQGHVNKINLNKAVDVINEAVDARDEPKLMAAMTSREAGLSNVNKDNSAWYMQNLVDEKAIKAEKLGEDNAALDIRDIQSSVNVANNLADRVRSMENAVKMINKILDTGTPDELMTWLQKPEGLLPVVDASRPNLYMDNLKKAKSDKGADLNHDDLADNMKCFDKILYEIYRRYFADRACMLLAVAAVNQAIDMNDENKLEKALENPDAKLREVDESLSSRYLSHFVAVKKEKQEEVGVEHGDLNHVEIQALIEYVNTEVQEENDLLAALSKINDAINSGDPDAILKSLQQPSAKLRNVRPKNAELYAIILRDARAEKAKRLSDENAELWHEEIQQCIDKANAIADEAEKLAAGMVAINEAVDKPDSADLLLALKSKAVSLKSITPECSDSYHVELKESKTKKDDVAWNGWCEHRVPQGYTYYHNYFTKDFRWSSPPDYQPGIGHLNRDEVQGIITKVTANHDRELFLNANEPSAVKLQAQWRGYKARKDFEERKDFLNRQLPAIIKIQSWWRGRKARKEYQDRLDRLHGNMDAVVKIQAAIRGWLARKKYQDRLKYFRDHIDEIVKIQAFLRANLAHHDYKMLSKPQPPVKSVRKFLHLLEHDHIDFQEELELQKLKAQVVTDIRSLAQLEGDLNTMDIKIGLLVRNRITLQDVVMHNKKLKKRNKADALSANQNASGIKALSREKREQLEAYQHLFYLLQTNPTYLARLIFKMPQSKTTKFMESVVLTLYNYASNSREEYLLLKLFETALKEEIMDKIDQIVEIVTGNPTVIKMVVHFNRGAKGQSSLRELLSPLVKEVLTDKNLVINTSPVEVYKQWINQMETETGKTSDLPYDVDNEFAMKQPEVVKRITASNKSLSAAADKFLNSFIKNMDKIPYGMRYTAKVLKESLFQKFPQAQEDDILKVVGNLIYYRYMNPAIVAPDAFDIVDITLDKGLTPDQRRNLGSIAKVLQYAASNKMFDRENAHLSALNPYITEAFGKFKKFFNEASSVDDAETQFSIDQYSDVTMVAKPVVYMTVQEMIDTHQLLTEHVNEITSEEDDPLKELLDDLGDVPSVEEVVGSGKSSDQIDEEVLSKMARTEISLTLTNKFEVPDDDDSDMKALFVRTKKLIVEVMRVQQGETLCLILETPATKHQEMEHMRLQKGRVDQDKKEKKGGVQRSTSAVGDSKLPLREMKKKIQRNLKVLEQQNLVSSKNDYQEIVNAIAKDIRNQRKYRQRRKQELQKLKQTLENLNRKSTFYEEQVDYFQQYIKVCLDNLNKKKNVKGKKGKKHQDQVIAKGSIKYSAQKLYKEGVVLEIEGLPQAQFKNVQFEISSSDDVGVFSVSAKFMGVAMEKVELVFQDLLQLQYDGVAVMKMFGKAKINVNLLIFLLNKKFYGK